MQYLGKLSFGVIVVSLIGCEIIWDYEAYDAPAPGTGGTATNGMGGGGSGGGAGVATSSSGGAGDCSSIVCDERPVNCPTNDCPNLNWAMRVGNGANQFATDVALTRNDMLPGVIAVGNYYDESINFGDKDLPMDSVVAAQAFVAYRTSEGFAAWTTDASIFGGNPPYKANAVGVDENNRVVVGGSMHWSTNAVSSGYVGALLTGANVGDVSLAAIHRFGESTTGPFAKTEVIDIAVDGLYTFVLVSVTEAGNINWQNAPLAVVPGFFVAKLNSGFDGLWIKTFAVTGTAIPRAITARNAVDYGVWVTGLFDGEFAVPTIPTVTQLTATGGNEDAFVLRFDDNGNALTPRLLREETAKSGFVDPLDMAMDSLGNGYIVGEVSGDTVLDENIATNKAPAGFIAKLAKSDAGISWKHLYSTGTEFNDVARLTSIDVATDHIIVAGTFSNQIRVDTGSSEATVMKPGNNPFVAKLALATGAPIYFDYFLGFDEGFQSRNIRIAASDNAFAMAGSWIKAVDFSALGGVNGMKGPTVADSALPDIILARFGALP